MSFPWNLGTIAVGKKAAFMGRSTQIVAACLWSHPRTMMRSWRSCFQPYHPDLKPVQAKGRILGMPLASYLIDEIGGAEGYHPTALRRRISEKEQSANQCCWGF